MNVHAIRSCRKWAFSPLHAENTTLTRYYCLCHVAYSFPTIINYSVQTGTDKCANNLVS